MDKRVRYIIGFIGIALLVAGLWYFRSLVAYVLIAAAISILGQPLLKLLTKLKIKKKSMPQSLAAAITLILIWGAIILFFSLFIPLVIHEANILSQIDVNTLYSRIQEPLEHIQQALLNLGLFENSVDFQNYITTRLMSVLNVTYLSNIFSGLTATLGNLLIAFFAISFITFFFLKDASLFSDGLMLVIPDQFSDEIKHILNSIKSLLTRYLGGIIIEVILVMILVTLGLWLVGIGFEHAVLCGLFSGILNVIPYIGPWIGAAFSILIGVATNIDLPFQSELLPLIGWMVLVFATVQTIDNVLFQPLIYSSSVNAHPLEIFLIIMMAGSLAGIGGMVLAIPTYTVLRVIAKEFLSSFKVVQKLTKNI
ncbi:MAG: AI-2E family transporter [Bacteroidetes bacterium HGW-Bacteroidetes-4]|jgi:predicted PurR-regulated permease PerM|nr:MAG: AI-2E family transporter [Bacteroidetes bacterium HGW-Bacteroidetes-4]